MDYAGEGLLDAAAARRVILASGCFPGRDYVSGQRAKGKGALDKRLRGLAIGARYRPTLVLRDLDADAPCGGTLVESLWRDAVRDVPHDGLLLRVAVRSLEAWILADALAISKDLGCPADQVPADPDRLDDPKASLIRLLRAAPNRKLREEVGFARAGVPTNWPLVARWLDRFIVETWQPRRASRRSPSLRRCLLAVARLAKA